MTTPLMDTSETSPTEPGKHRGHGPRGWTRRRKALVASGLVAVLLLATVAGYALWAKWRVDQALASVRDQVVFANIDPATRPPESPDGGMTFLLAGSDILAPTQQTGTDAGQTAPPGGTASNVPGPAGPGRSDVIMLVHVNGAHDKASVISIPRDSLVTIPSYTDANGVTHAAQQRKINAAFSFGGGTLLVRTVELLTGIRIDHFAYIDFDGLIRLIDAIGGVTVMNLHATHDVYGNPTWNFPKGLIPLDGFHARVWVSQRENLPRSDLDRARNSRILVQAIALKLMSPDVLSNPVRLDGALNLISSVATVDETLTPGAMKSLALSMRGINPASVVMRTAPTVTKTIVNNETVFILDPTLTPILWKAVATDDFTTMKAASQP